MSKEQNFKCGSSKLRKCFAGGLAAVFSSGMCSSCVGSAVQQQFVYEDVQFRENGKNLVEQNPFVFLFWLNRDLVLLCLTGNRGQENVNQDVNNGFKKQQAVEDDVVMLPEVYKELMKDANVSRDLLSKVRFRADGTVAMPESLYGEILLPKKSYLEKVKKIYNSFKENLVVVKEALACLPELLKENKWLLVPMVASLVYIILQILIPILLAGKIKLGEHTIAGDKLKGEGEVVDGEVEGSVGFKEEVVNEVEDAVDTEDGKFIEGVKTVGKVVAVAGTAGTAVKVGADVVSSLSGENGSSESVENEEGPFVFVKNSSSESSTKVNKKKKQSAV